MTAKRNDRREPSVWVVEELIDGESWESVGAFSGRERARQARDDYYDRWKKHGAEVRVSEYRRVPTRRTSPKEKR